MGKQILQGDNVIVKVSIEKMTQPWEDIQGTVIETAYKLENSLTRDKDEVTVFVDEFKTFIYKKAELSLSVTCRQAIGDAGQEILKNAFKDNTAVFVAWTKDFTQGVWEQTKVSVGEYQDSLEVSSTTDTTYTLALASGATLETITKPAA